MDTISLKRSLSLPLLTLYGIGAILGAGIYVLIGAVAAEAGIYSPLAFLLAALVAGVTGFSYAELSARFPRSAGEAVYIEQAFQKPELTRLVGLLVIFTGIVSSATMATGMVGYWQVFFSSPPALVIVLFIAAITLVACWGIRESAWLITLITVTEVGGLIFVLYAGVDYLDGSAITMPFPTLNDQAAWSGIMLAGFLAFYAYIGFEDMVNVAEEVKNPQRNLPLGILIALLFSTLLYMAVAIIALAVVPVNELAGHPAPLAKVVASSGYNNYWIAVISLIAIINGALVQIIMASRVLYGMAAMKRLPSSLAKLHPKTATPINATLWSAAAILILALWLPLATLAKTTSFIILTIFLLVNIALLAIKRRPSETPYQGLTLPAFVPLLGLLLCVAMLASQLLSVFS